MPLDEPLTLPEALLLLSLDDAKGTFTGRRAALDRAMIAGALLELWLRAHLVTLPRKGQEQVLQMVNALLREVNGNTFSSLPKSLCLFLIQAESRPLTNAYLETVYQPLKANLYNRWDLPAPFSLLVRAVLSRDVTANTSLQDASGHALRVAEALVARGLLQRAERTAFPFAVKTVYPAAPGDTGEQEIRLRLRGVILYNQNPQTDEWTRCLLGLVRVCGLVDSVFGKENAEKADWRIARLCRLSAEPGTPLTSALHYVGMEIYSDG